MKTILIFSIALSVFIFWLSPDKKSVNYLVETMDWGTEISQDKKRDFFNTIRYLSEAYPSYLQYENKAKKLDTLCGKAMTQNWTFDSLNSVLFDYLDEYETKYFENKYWQDLDTFAIENTIKSKFFESYRRASIAQRQLIHTFNLSIKMDVLDFSIEEGIIFLIDNQPIKCNNDLTIKIYQGYFIHHLNNHQYIQKIWIDNLEQPLTRHKAIYKTTPNTTGWQYYTVKIQVKYPYEKSKFVERRVYYFVEK